MMRSCLTFICRISTEMDEEGEGGVSEYDFSNTCFGAAYVQYYVVWNVSIGNVYSNNVNKKNVRSFHNHWWSTCVESWNIYYEIGILCDGKRPPAEYRVDFGITSSSPVNDPERCAMIHSVVFLYGSVRFCPRQHIVILYYNNILLIYFNNTRDVTL